MPRNPNQARAGPGKWRRRAAPDNVEADMAGAARLMAASLSHGKLLNLSRNKSMRNTDVLTVSRRLLYFFKVPAIPVKNKEKLLGGRLTPKEVLVT